MLVFSIVLGWGFELKSQIEIASEKLLRGNAYER